MVKPSIQKRKRIDLLLKMTSSCNQRITNGHENVTTIRLTLLLTHALVFVFFFSFSFFSEVNIIYNKKRGYTELDSTSTFGIIKVSSCNF